MTKPKPNLFCYNGSGTDSHEIKLTLSSGDLAAYDSLSRERWMEGDSVLVTDLATNAKWRVRRANCGTGCYCAAEAVPASGITGITLNERELAAVLAGLRMVQRVETAIFHSSGFPPGIKEILTNGGRLKPLERDQIDSLCERINK